MRLILLALGLFIAICGKTQLLQTVPNFVRDNNGDIEIILDASKGNLGLKDYSSTSDVYVHTGVITSKSANAADWKYSKFTWATTPSQAQAVYLGSNKWKFTIPGGLRSFYGITDPNEEILSIAILFRNGAGTTVHRNADQSDMYVRVYGDGIQIKINEPALQPMFNPVPELISKAVGENISISATSSESGDLKIFFNGLEISSAANSTTISANPVITTGGNQEITVQVTKGSITSEESINFFVTPASTVAPLPQGVKDGINYEAGDTSVILVLYAPSKTDVLVTGDFNNWNPTVNDLMKKTPDGNRFWIRLTGLTPGQEYAYQYLVDGVLKIADYNTEKVLDPNNDQFIPASTYPALKAYPTGKTTGIVSVLQTAKPVYNWQVNTFNRPDKKNLVIYELLLRDFLAQPNYKVLKDTLSYLKRLGVNVIELLPVNEFEGNISWGYNPSFYFAPDKYYGTENDLRAFIDACHQQGIAVVLDIALNHSFGQSPMVQLYWDAANNRPAAHSPWFNPEAKHPFNVGYDFNHESAATSEFVDRVVEHWLQKYKIDGFRWDLSKGFTQKNNPNDVGAWGAYDATRVAIWKKIYAKMQAVAPGSYCILEHFADNNEEKELSDAGMLLWGNANYNFNEATMGYVSTSNFQGGLSKQRGWSQPHLVTYQESHDEERLAYKNSTFGNNSNASHNVRTLSVSMSRNGMAASFWALMPGPKMLWQFGELGYDYSITYCPSDNSVPSPYPSDRCRTDPKPVKWEYKTDPDRNKLYTVYSKLLQLRAKPSYITTFTSDKVTWDLNAGLKWMKIESDSLDLIVVGNFDVVSQSGNIIFPRSGKWYSYLTDSVLTLTAATKNISLKPGEYYVFTSRNINNTIEPVKPEVILTSDYSDKSLTVFPNPVDASSVLMYQLPQAGRVYINMYDMQGRHIGLLFRGNKPKGTNTLNLFQQLPLNFTSGAGNYFITVDVNGKRMKKAIFIAR
jgi:glycosidase